MRLVTTWPPAPVLPSSAFLSAVIRSRFLIRWAAHAALISEHGMPQTFSV